MREENLIIWIEHYNQVQKPRNSLSDWLTFGHELIFDPHVNWNKNMVCRCHDTQNEVLEEYKWIYGLSYILCYNYWNFLVTILQLLLSNEDCLFHDFRSTLKLFQYQCLWWWKQKKIDNGTETLMVKNAYVVCLLNPPSHQVLWHTAFKKFQ